MAAAAAHMLPSIFNSGVRCSVPRASTVVANANANLKQQELFLSRRRIGILVSLLVPNEKLVLFAGADDLHDHYEEENFKLDVPKGWARGEGKLSTMKKLIAFHPQDDTSANVNVLVTILGSDFTSLGSFGTPETFAANMVGSMDRSQARPPGMAAKLLNASSKNGLYLTEYVTQTPGEAQRHLISAVGISKGKYYNKLLSATAQYMEEDASKYQAVLEQVIASFDVKDS